MDTENNETKNESSETNPHYGLLIFNKGGKTIK